MILQRVWGTWHSGKGGQSPFAQLTGGDKKKMRICERADINHFSNTGGKIFSLGYALTRVENIWTAAVRYQRTRNKRNTVARRGHLDVSLVWKVWFFQSQMSFCFHKCTTRFHVLIREEWQESTSLVPRFMYRLWVQSMEIIVLFGAVQSHCHSSVLFPLMPFLIPFPLFTTVSSLT